MRSDEAYDLAWSRAARNPDGTVVPESLERLVADLVRFDVEEARLGLARRIIARRKRPGQTAPEGSIVLPGMESYAYEPRRLLVDDEGNLIENQSARVKFKVAEARRAQEGARKALERATREQNEAGHFATWSAEQHEQGRDPREVTWDNCVRETGLWKDTEAEVNAEDDDEDQP